MNIVDKVVQDGKEKRKKVIKTRPSSGTKKLTKTRREEVKHAIIELAKLGCTIEEIGGVIDMHPSHIHSTYKKQLDEGYGDMKKRIRQKQLEVALIDKNPAMLIHLGKTILKQTTEVTVTHENKELEDVDTKQLISIVRNGADSI